MEEIKTDSELPAVILSLPDLYRKNLPKIKKSSDMALAAMQAITEVTTDAQYEAANALLVRVRKTYVIINPLRMELTKILNDEITKLIDLERPLSDKEKNNEYARIHSLMVAQQQKKLDEAKAAEVLAKQKEAQENYKVELTSVILKRLSALVVEKTKKADTGSKEYFDATTIDTWDNRTKTFMSWTPKLDPKEYTECFAIPHDVKLIDDTAFAELTNTVASRETYEIWNEAVLQATLPIINQWRARIPELKQKLVELANAKSEGDRKKLADEQAAKEEADLKSRQAQLDQAKKTQETEIDQQAERAIQNNSFVTQATVQNLEVPAEKKLLKFDDPKKVLQALTTVIYHSMAHPKFPGIQKKKGKDPVTDKEGRPEYIEAIDWWLKFCAANCDVDIDGIKVFEVAKITVKK